MMKLLAHALPMSRQLLLILRRLARRPTTAARLRTTCSLATSTMTSSTPASLHQLAFPPSAPSATQQLASTAPRTARLTASSVGASLAAFPALSQHRRLLLHALVSLPPRLTHARRLQPLLPVHALLTSRQLSPILR